MGTDSYWLQTTKPTDYPVLTGDVTVDVAVIGGGVAGLCAAWQIARAGRRVAVVEAGRIASATSGYTTAKVTALHTLVYADLAARRGPEAAGHYARAQTEALERVEQIADELGVDCEFERRPAYTYTCDDQQVETYRQEAKAAADAGLAADLTTETGLPFPVAAAVRVQNQAQFHPRKFMLALAADLTAHQGLIFENSHIVSGATGTPCRISTADGATVSADAVLVTTGWPIFDRPELLARLRPRRELVVAGPVAASADPDGMYITPEGSTRSVRTAPLDADRRLLIVTGEHYTAGSGGVEQRYQTLADWARPLGLDEVVYRWSAQDYSTSDAIPFIGRYPGRDRFYLATGFGGWGMTNALVAAQILAARVTDAAEPPWAALFDPRRFNPVKEAATIGGALSSTVRNYLGRPAGAGQAASLESLQAGQAAVLRVNGEEMAVYRDEHGALHAVGSRCSHLGCHVGFNDAERTWECPCHGSRFDIFGAVLQGPALKPLPRKDISDAEQSDAPPEQP